MTRADVCNDVVVVAHRAPVSIQRGADGRITFRRVASGVATALEPLARQYAGLWVAHGEASADHVAVGDREDPMLPPATSRYRVHFVPVPEAEYRGFYLGYANEGLWPFCHDVDVAPIFRPADFRMYQSVNERFASAVAERSTDSSFVFIQDYHFALVPRLLRKRTPIRTVAFFWHIPWPRPRLFRMCPNAAQLTDGLLASDVLGMQTPDDVENFLGFAELMDGTVVDRHAGTVGYKGITTRVRCYPAGIDWKNNPSSTLPSVAVCRDQVIRRLRLPAGVQLAVGVDRLDYTKGIREKFLAVEKLLERCRDLRGRFVFIQLAEPSRTCLASYRATRDEILIVRDRINARFSTPDWAPIHLLEGHHATEDVYRLYRAADVCYVASLRDGMNLVAKEFVAARDDERGVLVLSQFTGAVHQLRAAMLVNPRDVREAANTLARALATSEAEQIRRMRILRSVVERSDASWWAEAILRDAPLRARSTAILQAS